MGKSIKLKDDTYWDASSVVVNGSGKTLEQAIEDGSIGGGASAKLDFNNKVPITIPLSSYSGDAYYTCPSDGYAFIAGTATTAGGWVMIISDEFNAHNTGYRTISQGYLKDCALIANTPVVSGETLRYRVQNATNVIGYFVPYKSAEGETIETGSTDYFSYTKSGHTVICMAKGNSTSLVNAELPFTPVNYGEWSIKFFNGSSDVHGFIRINKGSKTVELRAFNGATQTSNGTYAVGTFVYMTNE